MKKSFFILALGLVISSFSYAKAETPVAKGTKIESKISVLDMSNLRLKVLFDDVTKNTASIEIYNAKGEVFYQELSQTNKPLVLNVEHLDDGAYTLAVSAGNEKLIYDFNIESRVSRVAVLKN
ncbi:T9SS type A sorting domain-containing protein [Emticicia sp. TH156]|uniref:T9SS type A sorting domain-containing protein n=1 Tax=Emticicia sp. TH156 TaxID=2067454 RepID=UPI000C761338|nr:T9SS type A sorting domain-containing protein [Emticicia sp. TH156]PLK45914.1 hypothetical protein C0V77_00735 [Emticicia sp. TH156]